jgi:Na+/melibiose symporter-like transporter
MAYAGVNVPFAMMQTPAFIILPSLYVQYGGLDLVKVGLILTVLRVADAVMDPAIGYLSDRTRGRFGRRKPWIAAGGLVAAPAIVFAFHPGPGSGYLWFALSYVCLTLGWTFAEIPHTAWLSEITRDYGQRSRLATYRYVAGMIGTALFPLISFLPWLPGRAITPQVTTIAGWLILALTAVTVPLALWLVPDRLHSVEAESRDGPAASSPWQVARSLLANRPLCLFMAMQALTQISSGMVSGLYYFYISVYLRLSEDYSLVMLAVYALSALGGLGWMGLGRFIDKHRVNALCGLLVAATNLSMFLIAPGPQAFALLIGVFSIAALATSGATAAQTALLADVADYGYLRSGHDYPGNYFAVYSFINKSCLAMGSGLALMIAGWFGFEATGINSHLAITGFFLAIIWIPLGLNLLAAVMAWFFPLNRQRQGVIARGLARKPLRRAA